ncbi:MAG: hypothetical protein WKG07_01835 [Hymenobacter sp.]
MKTLTLEAEYDCDFDAVRPGFQHPRLHAGLEPSTAALRLRLVRQPDLRAEPGAAGRAGLQLLPATARMSSTLRLLRNRAALPSVLAKPLSGPRYSRSTTTCWQVYGGADELAGDRAA